jgi:hypothetical protein
MGLAGAAAFGQLRLDVVAAGQAVQGVGDVVVVPVGHRFCASRASPGVSGSPRPLHLTPLS